MNSPLRDSKNKDGEVPDKVQPGTYQQDGIDTGMRVLAILISGIVFYGALGYGLDHLLGTVLWMPIGLILGTVLGIYLVIRKYGKQ